MADDPLDAIAALADAVLFEGYLLYPYRASAQKNALRWQFGVLVPPATAAALAEPSGSRTECVVDTRPGATLRLRLRFLTLRRRDVLDADGAEHERLDVDGTPHLAWDEGVVRQVDAALDLDALGPDPTTVAVGIGADEETEDIRDAAGVLRARYRRRSVEITGRVLVSATPLPGPYRAVRLRVDVVNDAVVPATVPREVALRQALLSAHCALALDRGAFLSCAAPPEWAAGIVGACRQEHSWPVLAGPPGDGSLLLASPIILEDHPQLAPESPRDLFDATENDEILTLRTLALTEDEKAEARATDPRAAALVDAVDAMGPAMFERLHGAIRPDGRAPDAVPTLVTDAPWWDPGQDASVDPEHDAVVIAGTPVARGSTVVLAPGPGGDAQDLFLAGAAATVAAVLFDVDGAVHVAVTLDDDPGADLQRAHGRFRYFRPEELVPVGGAS
jgi:hypothetical protein